jgi:putative FmdB family regulatory protein
MPVYTYRCEQCNYQFDNFQGFDEEKLKQCPQCKKMSLYRVYRPAGVVFKGSGYYVTDNRSSTSSLTGSGSNGSSDSSGNGKSESKPKKEEAKKDA